MKAHQQSSETHKPRFPADKPLRLALVGAGALGSEIAQRLAFQAEECNVSSVLIVDPDVLKPHNVALSHIYTAVEAQYGAGCLEQFKAELLAGALGAKGAIAWSAHPVEIADLGWQQLRDCDLLISCPDSALARVETAVVSRRLNLPMLDAGVVGGEPAGRVSWFSPSAEAACYLCAIGEARRADLLAFAASPSLGCKPLDASTSMGEHAQVPASVQQTAARVVELVARFSQASRRMEFDPARGSWAMRLREESGRWQTDILRLPRTEDCPLHHRNADRSLSLPADVPLRETLFAAAAPAWRLQLTWPVCVAARCRRCGGRQDRPQRLAALRRRGVCAGCGAVGELDPLRCLANIGAADAAAALTPRQLGLPDGHVFELRRTLYPSVARAEAQ